MKKFIIAIIAFLCICSIFIIVINSVNISTNLDPQTNYMGAIIDKHKTAINIKPPKIVFLGGSNVAFGIDTETLESKLKMPTVNLGLHAGLGYSFMFQQLKSVLHDNDVVFLIPEYFIGEEGNYKLKKNTQEIFVESNQFKFFSFYDELLYLFENTHRKLVNKPPYQIDEKEDYYRRGFNNHGDVIFHLNRNSKPHLSDTGSFEYAYWDGIAALNELYAEESKKNVKFVYMFPAYPKTYYLKNRDAIEHLYVDLRTNLKFKILGEPKSFVFDDSLFYDTAYHLNKSGRAKRTQIIETMIKNDKSLKFLIQ